MPEKIVLVPRKGAPGFVSSGYFEADLTGETVTVEKRKHADFLIAEGYADEFIEQKPEINYAALTKAELLALADERGIIADAGDTKPGLIALLSGATKPAAEPKGETE